jgi:site-specific recombinase XerD
VAELMYATGLRIAEVADLKPADIDFEKGLVHVHAGKMGIDRVCFLHDYAALLVRLYLDEFRDLTFNRWNRENGHLLFGTKWSNFEKTINKVLKRVSQDMGRPPFTSHKFRHCLGFHLLRSGCDVRYIQAILGHKLLRNTEVYTQVDKDALQEVFERCHPRTYRQEGRMTRREAKRLYKEWLTDAGYKRSTIDGKLRAAGRFLRWLSRRDLRDVTRKDIERYVDHLRTCHSEKSRSGVAGEKRGLSGFRGTAAVRVPLPA